MFPSVAGPLAFALPSSASAIDRIRQDNFAVLSLSSDSHTGASVIVYPISIFVYEVIAVRSAGSKAGIYRICSASILA